MTPKDRPLGDPKRDWKDTSSLQDVVLEHFRGEVVMTESDNWRDRASPLWRAIVDGEMSDEFNCDGYDAVNAVVQSLINEAERRGIERAAKVADEEADHFAGIGNYTARVLTDLAQDIRSLPVPGGPT